jgi:hypothetical protein
MNSILLIIVSIAIFLAQNVHGKINNNKKLQKRHAALVPKTTTTNTGVATLPTFSYSEGDTIIEIIESPTVWVDTFPPIPYTSTGTPTTTSTTSPCESSSSSTTFPTIITSLPTPVPPSPEVSEVDQSASYTSETASSSSIAIYAVTLDSASSEPDAPATSTSTSLDSDSVSSSSVAIYAVTLGPEFTFASTTTDPAGLPAVISGAGKNYGVSFGIILVGFLSVVVACL